MNAIYTIGYGNRTIEEFIRLLERYKIEFLIDVRSKPYSRFSPDFSKGALAHHLEQAQIKYIFMGDALGGRPNDPLCYTPDGLVDYDKCRTRPAYLAGIDRLKNAGLQGFNVAIMCSELRPWHCHRSKLIGVSLQELQIEVLHVDETGNLKTQEQVINAVAAELDGATIGQLPLFNDFRSYTSRKKHVSNPNKQEGID